MHTRPALTGYCSIFSWPEAANIFVGECVLWDVKRSCMQLKIIKSQVLGKAMKYQARTGPAQMQAGYMPSNRRHMRNVAKQWLRPRPRPRPRLSPCNRSYNNLEVRKTNEFHFRQICTKAKRLLAANASDENYENCST